MALVAAGGFDVSGNFVDAVRATNYAPESGVGVGNTLTDDGTRYYVRCDKTQASGERINIGSITFQASYTWAVRFRHREMDALNPGEYMSWISRGGVYPDNSQGALGFRDNANGRVPFLYGRNGSTLVGQETDTFAWAGTLVDGDLYTLVGRWQNGTQQVWLCAPDIGGAGVNRVARGSSTTGNGTDGGQDTYLGGPVSFTNFDASARTDLLGALLYDEYVDDTTLDAIAADFWALIPSASGPTIDTQPQNATVLLSQGNTAQFTVAATTSGGTLTYQWSVDDGGGYDPIPGATSATLNLTGIVIGQDGYLYRCAVTDDNGTTDSSAATLTVLNGDTLSTLSGTTDGSGEAVTQFTSDAVASTGQFAIITATAGGITKTVALRPVTPP